MTCDRFQALINTHWRALRSDISGVAMVEFAFIAPIMLLLGVGGIELVNFTVVNLRLSQAAVHVADNGSRIGDRDQLVAQRIYEGDLYDMFTGVRLQTGGQIDLFENGRVIISSLERNPDDGQWIHWQRCMGKLNVASEYGPEGMGALGTGFAGMGKAGAELEAEAGSAVIFVEIFYDYTPLVGSNFAGDLSQIRRVKTSSAYIVRGTRDLSGLYQRPGQTAQATCNKFETI